MSEKVLFEMRIVEDDEGTHIDVNAAPEWKATFRCRPRGTMWAGCWGPFGVKFGFKRFGGYKHNLRRTHDMLHHIYEDLYGHSAEAERGV